MVGFAVAMGNLAVEAVREVTDRAAAVVSWDMGVVVHQAAGLKVELAVIAAVVGAATTAVEMVVVVAQPEAEGCSLPQGLGAMVAKVNMVEEQQEEVELAAKAAAMLAASVTGLGSLVADMEAAADMVVAGVMEATAVVRDCRCSSLIGGRTET